MKRYKDCKLKCNHGQSTDVLLSLDDFEKYIKENYDWEEEVLSQFSVKLESELELLKYYDEYRTN